MTAVGDRFVNGIRLRVDLGGSGPRVLFCNGTGGTITQMLPLVKYLRGSLEVAIHDQRGLGDSEIPPGRWTMADYAADAHALLDDLGWETAAVIGVSFGGMVAQELAVTWPERISALVLACTSPGGALASYPLHELEDIDPAERAALSRTLMDTRFDDEWLAAHPSDAALVAAMAARPVAKPERQSALRRQLAARADHDVLDRLHCITCPTLVAAGRFDGIAPLPNSEAIAERVPGATLSVFDGGHAFFGQDPSALPLILEFLVAHA